MNYVFFFKNPAIEDYKRHATVDGRKTLCGAKIDIKGGHWFPLDLKRDNPSRLVEGAMFDCQRCCNAENKLSR